MSEPNVFEDVVRWHIEQLSVKPGDVIVLRTEAFRSANDQRTYQEQLSALFPDLRFMILPKSFEVCVLSQADAEQAIDEAMKAKAQSEPT